jgi:hypothetical protein
VHDFKGAAALQVFLGNEIFAPRLVLGYIPLITIRIIVEMKRVVNKRKNCETFGE